MTEKVTQAFNYILDRLGENSTWRGLILFVTGIGITLKPEQAAKITAIGLGVVGIINMFRQGSPTKDQVADALATKQDKV